MGLKDDIITANKKIVDCSIDYSPLVDHVPGKNNKYLKGIDKGREFHAVILYMDMRGSTKLVNDAKNKNVAKIHKAYFNTIVNCIEYFGGQVRSINGDSVLAFFNKGNGKDKADRAIESALNINHLLEYSENSANKLIAKYEQKIDYGIGITMDNIKCVAVGDESYGYYKDKLWISTEVNNASKIADSLKLPNCIGISKEVYDTTSKKKNNNGKNIWQSKKFDFGINGCLTSYYDDTIE